MGLTMPNYKPKMHMRTKPHSAVRALAGWNWVFCGGFRKYNATTDDWDVVTCGNCLRCRKEIPNGQ